MNSKTKSVIFCHCGKNLSLLNEHNYKLHIKSCKKRKNIEAATVGNNKITKFFVDSSLKGKY